MGYKDIINMDEIEKFYDNFVNAIKPNKKEFCNGMRGLREFGSKLKSKKPKWFGRFVHIAEYFGVPFYMDTTNSISLFKKRIERKLEEGKCLSVEKFNKNAIINDAIKEYFLYVEMEIGILLKKANTFLKFARKKKEQIQIETYPQLEIETPTYEHHSDNFYSEDLPEITDTEKSFLDTKYYLNMFIDILIKNLSEMVEKIKNEMIKFEAATLSKTGSYFDSLLKLSSEFVRVNKKEATPKDIDGLKNKLIKVLNDNKTTLLETMRLAERFHKKIQDENEDELPNVVYLTQISNCMGYLLNLTSDMSNINPFLIKQTLNIFNSIIFSFKDAIKQLENFKPTSLLITVPTYGFGEENAGRIEAEQAINQFGDLAESSFINGEQTVDYADILNQVITETQETIRKIITTFEKLINGFTKRYYWAE